MKKLRMRKHKIGKRERVKLEAELSEISNKLEELNKVDEDGFQAFYDDVEGNSELVKRKFWLEEVLQRGSYHKQVFA